MEPNTGDTVADTTWPRDVRIMEGIRELEQQDPHGPDRDELAEHLGMDHAELVDGLLGLIEGQCVEGTKAGAFGDTHNWHGLRLRERGRRIVGQWPSNDPGEALVQLLEERIAEADDAEATQLSKVLETVQAVGTGVLTGVLTEFVRAQTGL